MAEPEGVDIFAQDFIADEISAEDQDSSEIQEFYKGKTIFITGGTGFMGKVLVEKLLRSCPGIKRIYLLMRPKKGKDIQERFEEQFQSPLFGILNQLRSDFTRFVTPIPGDCGLTDLGLSSADKKLLIEEVNIVFHCAATVRFDEILRSAVRINIEGTKCVMDLATSIENLQSVVHISTAYSNCVLKEIHEKFYEPILDHRKLTQLIDILDDSTLATLTPTILKDYPNTYTYTKLVAEDVVREYGDRIPVGVIRPSIVISTATEPIAGWINNLYGPQGVVFGAGLGLLRTLHGSPWVVADMVPVDYAISATIALAWHIGITRGKQDNCEELEEKTYGEKTSCTVPILNYVSSERRPITWAEFMEYNYQHGINIPSVHQIWYYCFTLWNGYKKIHKFSKVISNFSTQQWKFQDNNVVRLWKNLSAKDKVIFKFDLALLDWDSYFHTYMRGLRQYMANDDMSTVASAKPKFFRMKVAHYTIKTSFYLLAGYVLWRLTSWLFLNL